MWIRGIGLSKSSQHLKVLEHGAGWEVIGTHTTGNETKEMLCGILPPQSLKLPWYFIFLKPECSTVFCVFFFFFDSLSYLVKPISSISPPYVNLSRNFLLLSIKHKLIKHFFLNVCFQSLFIIYLC